MQFTLAQTDLALALKAVKKTLPTRPHLPVLSGVLLRAQDQSLEITTTDLIAGVKVQLPASIKSPGFAVVSGKTFTDAVNFFDHEQTTLTLQEKELLIVNGRDKIKIPVFTEEFPDFSPPKLESQTFPLTFWQNLVVNVAFAASADQSRPALTGILLRSSPSGTQIVSTDGFRLAIWQDAQETFLLDGKDLIISAKTIIDAVALADIYGLESLAFAYDPVGEQVFLNAGHFIYLSKTINSNYPPFEKIIPLEFATQITLDRENLIKNLAKASVFTKSDSNTVKLKITGDQLEFTANSLSEGNFQSAQELDSHQGEDLEISFNIRYLLDFLNTRTTDLVWFGFNETTTPAMLRDPQDDSLQYVAMPFRPKN